MGMPSVCSGSMERGELVAHVVRSGVSPSSPSQLRS